MLQLFYWLGCIYKTLTLLSLIIYLPPHQYPTQISKGFLWLYINEIVLFFVSFYISYMLGQGKYELQEVFKLVTNVYFVVIYVLVMAWLMIWKKSLLSRNVEVLSIVFIIFSWMGLIIVGILSAVLIPIIKGFPIRQQHNQLFNFSLRSCMGIMHD